MTNTAGVYKITNIVTGGFYIGSSVELRKRLMQHQRSLIGNYHINAHLQNAWNKYGETHFEFSVCEYCEKERLIEREQFYIDTEKPSYNIAPIAGSCLGRECSETTRKKLSEAQMGERNNLFGKHHTKETRDKISETLKWKISESHTGQSSGMLGKHHSDDTKQKISEAQKGERGNNYGKKASEETRCRMRASQQQRREIEANNGF